MKKSTSQARNGLQPKHSGTCSHNAGAIADLLMQARLLKLFAIGMITFALNDTPAYHF